METPIANVMAGRRTATLNGREFIVAPLSLIVPGVLPGSRGPLLYTDAVVNSNIQAWNGMPLVGYHPRVSGRHVTARSPEVLDKQGLGWTFNVSYKGTLAAEGWFDVANVEKFDASLADKLKILPRLKAQDPIELSTGLFSVQNAKKGRHKDGREYIGEIERIVPDHVAILPDQVGACSIKDGCGVLTNVLSNLRGVYWFEDDHWVVVENADPVEEFCFMCGAPAEDGMCTDNSFCATGPGGGVDSSCGHGGDSSGASTASIARPERKKVVDLGFMQQHVGDMLSKIDKDSSDAESYERGDRAQLAKASTPVGIHSAKASMRSTASTHENVSHKYAQFAKNPAASSQAKEYASKWSKYHDSKAKSLMKLIANESSQIENMVADLVANHAPFQGREAELSALPVIELVELCDTFC